MDVGLKLCVVFLLMAFAAETTTTTEQPITASDSGVLLVGFGLWGDGSIRYLNLSDPSSGLHQLFTTPWPVSDVDYDPVDGMVYWIEYGGNTLNRSQPDGSGQQLIYKTVEEDDYGIHDMVVDVAEHYIYWTNDTTTIYRSHLNGSSLEPVVVASSSKAIDAITIDAVHRRIYWNGGGVWSSALNGSQVENVIADPVYQYGDCLEIDVNKDRLYWVGKTWSTDDGVRSFLGKSQTDGQGYQVLLNTTDQIMDLTLDHNSGVLYWIEGKNIYQMTPDNSTRQLVSGPHDELMSLHHVPGYGTHGQAQANQQESSDPVLEEIRAMIQEMMEQLQLLLSHLDTLEQ